MKLIYATDHHIKGRNPGSRLDDYPVAAARKMNELYEVCVAEQPDALILGGDFYDTPRVSFSLIIQYARILRKIRRAGIPIYLVPGNHDLFGYSMDTIDQTAIGVLAESGLVKLLTRKRSFELKDDKGLTVEIHGREYDKDIDTLPLNDYAIDPKFGAKYNVLFSHGMLLQKPFHPDVRHSLTSQVATTADLVLNGHYHEGYPVHTENGTIFANPGSSGRDEICKRMPQYAIIRLSKKNGIKVKYVKYESAADYNDIFDFSAKLSAKQHERYLEAFEQTVVDAMTFEAYNAKDVLLKLTAAGSVDQEIIDAAFEAIIKAEQASGDTTKIDGYVEKQNLISITDLEIENFQSHKKTHVKLSPTGLNAITGASDSGKTGLVRALRWAFYNDPKGSDFIRHGESRATVTVRFSDGSFITRSRTHSDAGTYVVGTGSGHEKEFRGFGNAVPIDVANTHQMPKVEIAPGIERPLNFSFQLDGHFMLSESPMVRAAAIGRLTGVHHVDLAIKEKRKDLTNLTKDVNASEKRVEQLDVQIAEYDDLSEMEKDLDLATIKIDGAVKLEAEIADIHEASQAILDADVTVKDIRSKLKAYDRQDDAEKRLLTAEKQADELKDLMAIGKELSDANRAVKSHTATLERYKRLPEANQALATLESQIKELSELSDLYSDLIEAEGAVSMHQKARARYNDVILAEDQIEDADRLLAEIKELRHIETEFVNAELNISVLEDNLKHQIERETLAKAKMKHIFSKMGNKCPMCQQDLDDAHMEHVIDAV